MKNILILTGTSLLLFLLLLLVPACERENKENSTDVCILSEKIMHKWIFLGFGNSGNAVTERKPDNIKKMSIEFRSRNSFGAISACNGLGGYYCLYGTDSIRFDSILTTLRACLNDTGNTWDNRYSSAIHRASNYYIDADTLRLQAKDHTALVFRIDK